ncbi:YpoC family protein [Alkalibacillus haloalkaliphilus]|uniref:YpoC-like domain-containing protein n=1 Tax=Alkalibacillus haloalkaliphilus TaxID=94136 RepID=A0A511W241_9BACI|nr:hypothetical protein [Alkalibacillus haloalkaliphilus]GEN45124.1 hypothetical protein AHA02nite_09000 [Alkalibacillus haloalkaliphilus]
MNVEEIESKFSSWEEISTHVEELAESRQFKETKSYVLTYLEELKQIILLCNQLNPSDVSEDYFDQLQYAPINVGERLQFIETRCHHRHGYIQLNEMYKEMKKKYAIAKLKHQAK